MINNCLVAPRHNLRNCQNHAAASCGEKAAARSRHQPTNPWEFLFSFHRRRLRLRVGQSTDGGDNPPPVCACVSCCSPSCSAQVRHYEGDGSWFVKAICCRGIIVRFSFRSRSSPAATVNHDAMTSSPCYRQVVAREGVICADSQSASGKKSVSAAVNRK